MKLERLLIECELSVSAYDSNSEAVTDLQAVQELTKRFINSARTAITDETIYYFEEFKFPNLNLEEIPEKS